MQVLLLATSALAGVIPANLEDIILEQQPSDHQPVYHQQQSIGASRPIASNPIQQSFDQNVFIPQTKNAQPTIQPQPFVPINCECISTVIIVLRVYCILSLHASIYTEK